MADDKVTIGIDTKYDDKGLKAAQKDLKQTSKDAKEVSKATQNAGNESENSFGKFAKYAAMAGTAIYAVKKAVDFLLSSVRAAAEHARSVNTLSAAFKNVGYTAQGALKQAQDFASKMQNLTGIADEAFLNAQRLLANYGVVGAKAQQAVEAAYALSIGRGIEFASAMDLVAKAAAGQTSALSRVGIVLGDNVKAADKFDAVLGQINDKFGATAKAAMGDYLTQVNALKESWGDFKEQIGKFVIPALLEVIRIGQQAVNVLNQVFGHQQSIIQKAYQKEQEAVSMLSKEIARQEQMRDKAHISHQRAYNERIESLQKELDKHKAIRDDLQKQFDARARNTKVEMEAAEQQAAAIEKTRVAQIKKNAEKEKEVDLIKKAAEEEEKRVRQVLNDAGVGPKQTTSGWDTSSYQNKDPMSMANMLTGTDLDETQQFLKNIEEQKYGLEDLYKKKLELLQKGNLDDQTYLDAKKNLDAQYRTQTALLDEQLAQRRQKTMATALNNLASLQNSNNKKMAEVGKAAAIAQATIDTYKAANAAYSAMAGIPIIGPALGAAAAAAAIVAGLNNVAQISNIKLAEGGLVKAVTGGVPAVIGEGGSDEAVLPLDDTKAMRRIGGAIAEEGGAVGGVVVNINVAASGGVEAILDQLTDAARNGTVQALEFANLNFKVGQSQQGYSV